MEFRAWISVPLRIESDDAERLLSALEQRRGEMGPVLGGTADGLEVIIAVDGRDEAEVAGRLFDAVVDGLTHSGLGSIYPTRVVIEPVVEPALA